MYKLAVIDLDGTMLNQYGIVTQKTKDAIHKARENGIEVIIASGRPIDSIKTIAKEIKSEKYFIECMGFCLYCCWLFVVCFLRKRYEKSMEQIFMDCRYDSYIYCFGTMYIKICFGSMGKRR